MPGSFTIARIAGISIGIHSSWLIVFALIAWSLAVGFFPFSAPGLGTGTYWLLGIGAALLLFASVLVHELSHSFMARARGLRVRGITLFIFGGASNIEGESKEPLGEFLIAVVGPLTSFVLAGVFWVLAQAVPPENVALNALLGYLAFINLALGVFNLVPGFPLDGGRVLRSILWTATGSLRKATQWASYAGQLVGFLLIAWGVFQVLTGNFLGGLWIGFIGWFLNSAAEATRTQQVLAEQLRGIVVSDIMNPAPPVGPPSLTVREFVAERAVRRGERAILVMDDGRLVGLMSVTDAREVPQEDWDTTPVGRVMTPAAQLKTVSPDAELQSALQRLVEHSLNQVPVVKDDRAVGLLTRADVLRFLQLREELGHYSPEAARRQARIAAEPSR